MDRSTKFFHRLVIYANLIILTVAANPRQSCPFKNKYLKAISVLEKTKVNGLKLNNSHQVTELKSRFLDFFWTENVPKHDFQDWNKWRENDGFLCRNDNDCKWLGYKMECQIVADFDWEIDVSH